jgi:hypothetical protein
MRSVSAIAYKIFQIGGDTYYRINRIARLCKTFQVCGDTYSQATCLPRKYSPARAKRGARRKKSIFEFFQTLNFH